MYLKGDDKYFKEKKEKLKRLRQLFGALFLLLAVGGFGFFFYYYMNEQTYPDKQIEEEFQRKFQEVCQNPKLAIPEYRGVGSFYEYLSKPDQSHCYSWLEFGGEKIIISKQQNDTHCKDEIRKTKMICFNEEYQMTKDPCLVYSFTKDGDSQFERDMHMFSCEVHAFDSKQVAEAEHVRRTEFWLEHAWDVAEMSYDSAQTSNDFEKNAGVRRRRDLSYIVNSLNHKGKVLNFVKSDNEGRVWSLLRQLINHHDLIDVHQIGVLMYISPSVNKMTGTDRHEYFRKRFQVFQGLACLGYKFILNRDAPYYNGRIELPEVEKFYKPAFELNFAKVIVNRH